MADIKKHHFSAESMNCAAALQNTLIASSSHIGWTSCLLDHVEGDHFSETHETHVTPDLTVVVATRGEHDVEVFSGGRWHQAIYQVGSTGLTPGGESTKLRWRNRYPNTPFRTAHLYVPSAMIAEASDLYRRPGQVSPAAAEIASRLIVSEQTASTVVYSLVRAMNNAEPDIYADSAVRWLAIHLVACYQGKAGCEAEELPREFISDQRLSRAIEYMSANVSKSLSIEDIAREACVSPFHFSRLFRRKLGVTPHKYLTTSRMEKARRLLSTTDLPIAIIGKECGYSLPSSFTTAFAKHFGKAPNRFGKPE